jgi:hypothetical protein
MASRWDLWRSPRSGDPLTVEDLPEILHVNFTMLRLEGTIDLDEFIQLLSLRSTLNKPMVPKLILVGKLPLHDVFHAKSA